MHWLTKLTLHNVIHGITPYEPIFRALLPEPRFQTVRIEFDEQFLSRNREADILNRLDALFASSDLRRYEDKLTLRLLSPTNSRCWHSLAQQRALFSGRYTLHQPYAAHHYSYHQQ